MDDRWSFVEACMTYGFVLIGLKKNTLPSLKKDFLKCSSKLRKSICNDLGIYPKTSWMRLLKMSGALAPQKKSEIEKQDKLFHKSFKILLSKETSKLCEELDIIRYWITGTE